jgi:sensor histidine kinase YesM
VIQPLVENAIKHGISECVAGGEVRISARLQENDVIVTVLDTGVGVAGIVLERRRIRGLGLSNVEQRLRRYGALHPLMIQSAPGLGTTVEIRVPLQSADQMVSVR